MRSNPHAKRDPVPLKYARSMLQVAEAQGYNGAELLRSLQLPIDPLSPSADLDSPIDAQY